MSKKNIVAAVAQSTGMSQGDADKAVSAALDAITSELAKGEKVSLPGFGTFEVRDRAARTGRNPQTGEEIEIAATKVPAFKAGTQLKKTIAG
ncbi:HU family DNA-binding protein [Auraticoccus monumenti]|uniref:DNA-binding protein HU-beta n=1 Tax=Auraticoccus monumenti TaxID=675864 RepID=A0A1G6TXQ8_9ACTN|nr:HU family DNA-binding protein [Auraticoccus monumenti]SDD33952.1 DNA-binding protein HU-beta [Auraticoccus monumenti]